MSVIESARSLLFVPGSRPDRFDKAMASGADVVIIDLEDAVGPSEKETAAAHVTGWLHANRLPNVAVRVNADGTPWHDSEIRALAPLRVPLVVPKADSASDLAAVAAALEHPQIIALVESAVGLRDLDMVLAAPGVVRAALGTIDLSTELGVDPQVPHALSYARSRVVAASAAARLPGPIDGPTTAVRETNQLAADLTEAAALGFAGRLCVHPTQVNATNRAFMPSAVDLEWARRVCAAATDESGVVVVDGGMVDAPVLERARRLLDRARALQPTPDT